MTKQGIVVVGPIGDAFRQTVEAWRLAMSRKVHLKPNPNPCR